MGREKILIVDDDDGVREMLAEFFGVLGYPSIVACNGREALGLLETQEVALVISDIKMPVMDGIEMLKRIKEAHADLDVILITGYESDYSRRSVREAGASDYLCKPFNIDVIEKKVKSLMDKRSARRGDAR
ncbi:MAG: response regulator [Deltaproteobacteria bacterium]|nr:response regulator [Deltaproteobacteria bacterium]